MYIDRIIYPVTALGPGKRIALWTLGCTSRCPECANRELWETDESRNIPVDQLAEILNRTIDERHPDGITVTGGEPLDQAGELLTLLGSVRKKVRDILVYTGKNWDSVRENMPDDLAAGFCESVSVLIDGPYIGELNDNKRALAGSLNQRIIYFDTSVKEKYEEYISRGRTVQNIISEKGIISVGIHNR